MSPLQGMVYGFSIALSPVNLFYCFIGCLIGTLVGVLPGIGPAAAIALVLPATFHVNPTGAIIMLAGIFYGAQYGGSTTSILSISPEKLLQWSLASMDTRWREKAWLGEPLEFLPTVLLLPGPYL